MTRFRIISLFSGIGGFDLGFQRAGHEVSELCEFDPFAKKILGRHFPNAVLHTDVRDLSVLPRADVVTAGWPCQDISQAGRTNGLRGKSSRLIGELFRLLEHTNPRPEFIVLENVSFLLHLKGGATLRTVLLRLEKLGYAWAYRILNSIDYGLPQRRRRIFILASRTRDPRAILLENSRSNRLCAKSRVGGPVGFYWTEGNSGIGWAPGAIPPLKGGSGLRIPSPPAIWFPRSHEFFHPTIEEAEQLQGFPKGWTEPAESEREFERDRWRLVGNAVSVPVAQWLASRLCIESSEYNEDSDQRINRSVGPLPPAAWGMQGKWHSAPNAFIGVQRLAVPSIGNFVRNKRAALSRRAAAGLLSRLNKKKVHVPSQFLADLESHIISK